MNVSFQLAAWTTGLLLPPALLLARWLAWTQWRARGLAEALVALPLVLPPTVMGFYLLGWMHAESWLGKLWFALTGGTLVFSFEGIVLACMLANIPFAVQPLQRAFESIPVAVREAAWLSGLSRWRTFWKIELPLIWPGLVTALVLCFAHTLGEFGVVLMVGGAIHGETRTVAIAIYDQVQAFDDAGAAMLSAVLVVFALITITVVFTLGRRASGVRHA